MMTTAAEYQDRRWQALALLCMAQFVVVLDASIVNVALPSIGEGLGFSQDNLPWVVNAYVLTFGGFLLLGGRMADLLGRRRVFMAGPGRGRGRLAGGGLRRHRGPADRGPRRAGPGSGDHLALRALDRHHPVHRRRRAQQGAGRLGRGRRLGRRRRRAARRHPHRRPRLGVGAVGERARGDHRPAPVAAADPREPRRGPGAQLRRRRRGHGHRRADGAGLRAGRRHRGGLGQLPDAGPDRALGGAARRLRRDRAALFGAAGPVPHLQAADPDRGQRRRAAAGRVAVLDVLLHQPLHAAGAGLLGDQGRAQPTCRWRWRSSPRRRSARSW